MSIKVYTGVGSRSTPPAVLNTMASLARCLAAQGWVLRSGGAMGADLAFEVGVLEYGARSLLNIYTVSNFFKGHELAKNRAEASVDKFHPAPHRLTRYVRTLMARNYFQVVGNGPVEIPSEFLVCWTPRGEGGGGTGQAIRIAKSKNIMVLDLGVQGMEQEYIKWIENKAIGKV